MSNCRNGLGSTKFNQHGPLRTLRLVRGLPTTTPTIFVLQSFRQFLSSVTVSHGLHGLKQLLGTRPGGVIVLSPRLTLPRRLKRAIAILRFALPDIRTVHHRISRLLKTVKVPLTPAVLSRIIQSYRNLSLRQVQQILNQTVTDRNSFSRHSLSLVLRRGHRAVHRARVLSFCPTARRVSSVNNLSGLGS